MKRFAILFSVAAVFVCVTAAYYLSYRLSGDRQTQEPQAPTTSFLQSPSGRRETARRYWSILRWIILWRSTMLRRTAVRSRTELCLWPCTAWTGKV